MESALPQSHAREPALLRWSPGRAVGVYGTTVAALAAIAAIMALVFRRDDPQASRWLVVQAVIAWTTFFGLNTALTARRPPYLRLTPQGVEMASTRRDPVFVPWSAVSDVRLRHRGWFTELVLTPTDAAAVMRGYRASSAPRYRRRGGRVVYLADVGMLRGGPKSVGAVLSYYGCPGPAPSYRHSRRPPAKDAGSG